MALSTIVKINSVNNLSDARYAAGMGVQMMGFDVQEGSERHVDPYQFAEIVGWLSGVETVAEIGSADVPAISQIRENYSPDRFQSDDRETVARLLDLEVSSIWEISINEITAAKDFMQKNDRHRPDYILVKGDEEVLSDRHIEELAQLSEVSAVLLGNGFDSHNVTPMIQKTHAMGIAITGGDEIRPGLKDFDEMAEILEGLEIND